MLLVLNIQRNQLLFCDINMQIRSLINGVPAKTQHGGIQHGLNELNDLNARMISGFQGLQRLRRIISILSIQLALA
jgi:hypothetical protein